MSFVQELRIKIAAHQEVIERIQEECSHPQDCMTKVPEYSTDDFGGPQYYRYRCECKLCEKIWYIKQER